MVITDKQNILDFLSGIGKDYYGRTYKELIEENDQQIENCHDAVQFCFPLHENSRLAKVFPIITKEIANEAKQNPNIINNLLLAKDRFEKFFAIGNYEDVDKQRKWCKPRNHNLLRITRIIRCLRIFGLDVEAYKFYQNVRKVADRFGIPNDTYSYWYEAYNGNVWDSMQK